MRLLFAAILITAFTNGCAPRGPETFDYVPDWKGADINCKQAELFLAGEYPKFQRRDRIERYSDCYTIFVSLMKFESAGGPCSEAPLDQTYAGIDMEALKQWLSPCEGIFHDANTYAAELQDYTVKEQSNALSWRDAMVILGAAALVGR